MAQSLKKKRLKRVSKLAKKAYKQHAQSKPTSKQLKKILKSKPIKVFHASVCSCCSKQCSLSAPKCSKGKRLAQAKMNRAIESMVA